MRGKESDWLPLLGALASEQTCNSGVYPDWESTRDLLLFGTTPNQLSLAGQGKFVLF